MSHVVNELGRLRQENQPAGHRDVEGDARRSEAPRGMSFSRDHDRPAFEPTSAAP
jgi:hypothetical protein